MTGSRLHLCAVLISLLLAQPVWGNSEQSLAEIESLIRMRDYEGAARRLAPLAVEGNPEAQYRLAGLYRIGKGVRKNLDRAESLYLEAARAGHADAQFSLALLLEKSAGDGSPAEAREWYGKAAAQGHRRAREKLAQWQEKENSGPQRIGRAGIFDAIRHNDVALIESLIDSGADLNLVDGQGNSTVMEALIAGWPGLAATLIRKTEWQKRANAVGDSPLHIAVGRDYREVVEALIATPVDINRADARGNTALMLAVEHRNLDLIGLLLQYGADPGLRNSQQRSAVDLAYQADNPAIGAVFARLGIEPRTVQPADSDDKFQRLAGAVRQKNSRYYGWPLLNLAIELGESGISNRLIAGHRELEATGPGGNRALHIAARRGDRGSLKRLLAQGAKVDARNRRNETALYLAAEAKCLECVELLLDKRADPAIATTAGVTPLEIAVQNGASKIAAALLATNTGYAGIHRVLALALENGMEDLARQLIPLDTELASLDGKRRSLLWQAAERGLQDTVSQLLAMRKIDIDQRDANGHGALARAVIGGRLKIAGMLLDAGAQSTSRTGEGNTLLMLAVTSRKPAMVAYLLHRGIDVDARNNSGDTALTLAAARGPVRVVEMLLDAGADPKIRNNDEVNAFQVANDSGHARIAKIIHDRSSLVFKLFN
ncbi:MAG: ankyrin repeat domain-containing protein [Gammaproteobacteria bacterium]|jgi:ankyrin repeat protein